MPLKSKAQARFLFATHPRIAKRWAKHTKSIKKLPARKRKMKHQKMERYRAPKESLSMPHAYAGPIKAKATKKAKKGKRKIY